MVNRKRLQEFPPICDRVYGEGFKKGIKTKAQKGKTKERLTAVVLLLSQIEGFRTTIIFYEILPSPRTGKGGDKSRSSDSRRWHSGIILRNNP